MAVLAVLRRAQDAGHMVHLAWQLASAGNEGLTVLCLRGGPQEAPVDIPLTAAPDEKSVPLIEAARVAMAVALEGTEVTPETPPMILRAARDEALARVVIKEAHRVTPSLLLMTGRTAKGDDDQRVSRQIFRKAACATLLLNGDLEHQPKRILVGTNGGPNARTALRVADTLCRRTSGSTLTVFNVQSPTVGEGEGVGAQIIAHAMKAAALDPTASHIKTRVALASSVRQGIGDVAADYDAIIVGSSSHGAIYRMLFGTLPESLLRTETGRLVGITRAAKPWMVRLRARLDKIFSLWVPQMARPDRITLHEQLQSGSQWGFDFMALIALSTSIAALGLIQSSTAVVIGAMLVAPLMTPILGAGLALLQGNQVLLRASAQAIILGFVLALFIGVLVGLVSPVKVLTPEMAARGEPTPLDIGIGLVSGMAAAYAYARPRLIAALPGVAIAAALVPPIATTGLAFAFGEWGVGLGAALLFTTNVVAIILGASGAFYATGLRGRQRVGRWASRVFIGLVAALMFLAIPLSRYLMNIVESTPSNLGQVRSVAKDGGYRFVRLERVGEAVEVHLQGPSMPPRSLVYRLRDATRDGFGDGLKIRVVTQLTIEVE